MNTYLSLIYHLIIFVILQFRGESHDIIRRRLDDDKPSELRIATFGTSRSFGALLQNRTKEAYPWLLSENAKNFAIRGSDARYPSMCLQSMLSDSIFDVIIVEYDRYTNNLHSCIIEMIRRLRTRFPKATIILTNIWLLWDIDVNVNGQTIKFPRWMNLDKSKMNPTEVISEAQRVNAKFEFNPITYSSVGISQKIAEKYNVKLYSWFGPNTHSSVQEELISHLPYFHDFLHWNNAGHLRVAIDINRIIAESQVQQTPNEQLLGEWTENDLCSLWIQSGIIDNKLNFRAPPNVIMKRFDGTKEKYALELPSNVEPTIFHVENPFNKVQKFYLTYMVSHPNRLYPRVEISIIATSANVLPSKHVIDPFEDHGYPAHFPVLEFIGTLHPGINYLVFKPLEITEFPFRIIGYSMSEVPLDATNSSSSYSWYF